MMRRAAVLILCCATAWALVTTYRVVTAPVVAVERVATTAAATPEIRYVAYPVTVETMPRPTRTPVPLPNCAWKVSERDAVCRWATATPHRQPLPLPTCGTPVASEVCVVRTAQPTPDGSVSWPGYDR